jgi:hypothetical protein
MAKILELASYGQSRHLARLIRRGFAKMGSVWAVDSAYDDSPTIHNLREPLLARDVKTRYNCSYFRTRTTYVFT